MLTRQYMHGYANIALYGDIVSNAKRQAAWKVYKMTGKKDQGFLMRVFQKLLLNFTWWVNRKDMSGNHIFSGGFLGLDNISIFDRSTTRDLEQADATSWMVRSNF